LYPALLRLKIHTQNKQNLLLSTAKLVARARISITLYVKCLSCYWDKHVSNFVKATIRQFKISMEKDNWNETNENDTLVLNVWHFTCNVILMRVRSTIFAVESNKYCLFWVCIFSLNNTGYNAHAPYYIVICGLSCSTIFSHIIS